MKFFLLFLVLILPVQSFAWTSKTYQIVVVQSVKLMPASFQRIMKQHKEEILRACLKPDDSGEAAHRYDLVTRSGFLQNRVLELSKSIPEKIHNHVPFRILAEDFGRLSHYMSDLNDPMILSDADPREEEYRMDFAIYTEKNIEKFPWVFDGHEDPLLEANDVPQYIFRIASRASEKYPRLGEAYFPNGRLVSSDTFDWRSLPFGIASLSYSHSITTTVQMWFNVWKQAHGDITYTPLYKSKGAPK
jgi:hypothetical protein